MSTANSPACLWLALMLAFMPDVSAQSVSVATKNTKGSFALSADGKSTVIYTNEADFPGVLRAARDLQTDIGRVTGAKPAFVTTGSPTKGEAVIAGTIGKNPLIDQLIRSGKLDVTGVAGKWETFVIQVIDKPVPGVGKALVIAGSDKRGTIFGIYDLSKQIGVSPWHWWADVPPKKSDALYVLPGRYVQGEPVVKYRGIFINDEEPALGRWAVEKYGGFNHVFYEKVFELILRMKGNYLWPAMWWASFNSDDTLNPALAHEYGIVVGTTHHEPMMRAHAEWRKNGKGPWDYEKNEQVLREFWRDGIRRMGNYESIVSLGMRGDGDMAMSEETNIGLLERIVKDQRVILEQETGKNVKATPQLWALYKEVQDYYDKGMRAPGDVTLLLCDDNWGNIRKLPLPGEKPRAGGYGIYYHFDYVGGPRNYKWLNTNQVSRVWEQMHLAYAYGATRIWIVNVGDIKPMEFPIEFFLDYAWAPDRWTPENLDDYARKWAELQFGSKHATAIAEILTTYTKYNARRKPELLSPETYSLAHYREAENVVKDYNKLVEEAERIEKDLPTASHDAYYQLVLHPVKASANLNELYVTVGRNRLYATQRRAATNDLAERAKTLFEKDAALSRYYNKTLAGGKWNHMMDQTHIGYTYWQQPEKDVMPEVRTIEIPAKGEMGIAIEGSEKVWPGEGSAVLPMFDIYSQPTYYIEIFNRGRASFPFTIKSGAPYVIVSHPRGMVEKEQRVMVSIDWKTTPKGERSVPVTISGPDGDVTVTVVVRNPTEAVSGFVENNGYVSIEAEHYTNAVAVKPVQWTIIPGLGRTLSAVTPFPVTGKTIMPGGDSPHLEYAVHLFDSGEVTVSVMLSPTLNFHNTEGLRYGISFDDEPPQIINLHDDRSPKAWDRWVSDNVIVKASLHKVSQPGPHTLKFWLVDHGVVLQKLVIATSPVAPGYLGPPESVQIKNGNRPHVQQN